MFDIVSVSINNFKSFVGEHFFELPTERGLYFLTGRNEVNPGLGANGIGKSTLLDAIFWALFGRTSRGLKAGDVISWGQKSCGVTVNLNIAGNKLEVIRTQAPNGLYLMGQPIDQAELQKHLRLGPDAFLYAVMIPQFGERFLDLAPAAKLTLFSQILELEYWLERSQAAHDLANHIAEDTARCERTCAEYRGKIDGIRESLRQAQEQEKAFEEDQKAKIKVLESERGGLYTGCSWLGKRIKDARRTVDSLSHKSSSFGPIETKKAVIEHDLNTAITNLKRLEKLGPECPTCLQLIDQKYLMSEKARFRGEIEHKTGEIQALDAQLKDKAQIERNKRDFEDELFTNQQKLARLEADREQTHKQAEDEKKRKNPHTETIVRCQKNQEAAERDLRQTEKEHSQLAQDHAAVSYWINGFKRIRLFIVEDTLRQLEVEVNSNLASLGLLDWLIEFDVERENKSGGVTKGFTVLVHAPGHGQPVKYEAWSGGELQRLRLAVDLGLANLIMNRAGLTNSIEFVDEPSAHLSDEGLLDLAETLMERALSTNKRILLVDHRLIDYAFTDSLCIIKDERGSRLERLG